MRNTLLTTTALVLSAGIASADGHASITWSGAVTAGVAREGLVAAKLGNITDAQINLIDAATGDVSDITDLSGTGFTTDIDPAFGSAGAGTAAEIAAWRKANAATVKLLSAQQALTTAEALVYTNQLAEIASYTAEYGAQLTGAATTLMGDKVIGGLTFDVSTAVHDTHGEVAALLKTRKAQIVEAVRASGYNTATAEVKAGKFKTYSEVSTTVTGSVTTDNGFTLTAAVSVDAGTGYDFASDDGFDAAKTNGVSLDNVSIAMGAMGTVKIDQNAVAHLVDGDDDAAADILYTNTFGSASFSAAIDISEDLDPAYVAGDALNNVTAVPNDVQWSAKISMPVAGGTATIAMDEEGGNSFGASTTLGGFGITFASKLEAHDEEKNKDRSNDLGLTYVLGTTTMGATWNSVEDGDQWGISAKYAGADGMSLTASTDEGSDWAISGSYVLGTGASVVGGVNYTEDAYLGLSFSF